MIVVWFRDDLRLVDHAAFEWAEREGARDGEQVRALYIWEPEAPGARQPCGRSLWWLTRSLRAHRARLAARGIALDILSGAPERVLVDYVRECGATEVAWQLRYAPALAERDASVAAALTRDAGVNSRSFPGFLLTEPGQVRTRAGEAYKVFTPFSRRAWELCEDIPPIDAEALYAQVAGEQPCTDAATPGSDEVLAGLEERAQRPPSSEQWQPGELGALARLAEFSDRTDYAEHRDTPALSATSRLSAHLRFGEISPAVAWGSVPDTTFRTQLLWRDFAWSRLVAHPDLAWVNVRREYDAFPWDLKLDDHTERLLAEWQQGRTGIPLVDAGMRELAATGYMHNRVRMVVGSWLTKNLGIHWRHGEQWLWQQLIDADPAVNPFSWQWVAGCGDDAAPYFRVFNPLTQAKKFDPEERYIRRWVPEYATADYPRAHADVKESRKAALAAYNDVRNARSVPTVL